MLYHFTFDYHLLVICTCQVGASGDEVLFIDTRVIQVVAHLHVKRHNQLKIEN